MSIFTLARTIRSGLVHFWRNIWLSLAATGIMVLTLSMLFILLLVMVLGQNVLKTIESKVDITAFIADDVDESVTLSIKRDIEGRDDVISVTYITQDQALAAFRERHRENPLIEQAITEVGDNPLQPQLVIRATDPDSYARINEALQSPRYESFIARVTFDDNQGVIERLSAAIQTIRNIGMGVTVALAIIAILVTFNTVRLAIYGYHREIEIMKLVGASPWLVRGPFVIEGVLAGIIAAIITLVLLYPLVYVVSPRLSAFFVEGQFSLAQWATSNVFFITFLVGGTGVLLGALSSIIAVRRYLKS